MIRPMIVVPPCWDYDQVARRPLTPAEHVSQFGPRLLKYWGKRPIAVDGQMLDDDLHCEGLEDHPLTALLSRARLAGATAMPVTDFARSERYQAAVARIVTIDRLGAVIRLGLADIEEPELDRRIEALLSKIECDAQSTDLCLDLSSRSFDDVDVLAELLINRINTLPQLLKWRSFSLAASEFPSGDELKKVKTGQSKVFRRGEWVLYERLLGRSQELARMPLFSDYGIEHPWFLPKKTGPLKPSVHLRYTIGPTTFVSKAPPKSGYEGIREVCLEVSRRAGFAGDNFSYGDRFIARCADGREDHGGPKTWRAVGHNHHMTIVVHDLAGHFGVTLVAPTTAETEAHQDMFV